MRKPVVLWRSPCGNHHGSSLGLRSHFDAAVYAVQRSGGDAIGQAMQRELVKTKAPLFNGTRFPLKRGGLFSAAMVAIAAVKVFRPDIIHRHTEIPEAAIAAMTALHSDRNPAALVRTIHNTLDWGHWPRVGGWCDRRLRRSYIAGVSQGAVEAFERLRTRSQAGPPPTQPIVIFHAVKTPEVTRPRRRHSPKRPLTRSRCSRPTGGFMKRRRPGNSVCPS